MEQLTQIDEKLRQNKINAYDGIGLLAIGTGSGIGLLIAIGCAYLSWRKK